MWRYFSFIMGLALAISVRASIDIQQFDNPQQEETYRSLIQELRCPQCQNNNIADSNATIAQDMRNKSLELLKQGKSRDEVIEYMVARYGNFVSYDPPFTVATSLLWFTPIALVGFGLWLLRQRRNEQQADNAKQKFATQLDQVRLKKILADDEDKV